MEEQCQLFEVCPTQMTFIWSVGLDEKSSALVEVIRDPRNENKCVLADQGRFGFLHFYPEIFYFITSFSTFVSKFSYSGMKYILLLAQTRDRMEFRGSGLTPSAQLLHRCLLEPQ